MSGSGRDPTGAVGEGLVELTVMRLRELIEQHREEGLNRLPPEKELGRQLGVGRSTLREALTLLQADGMIDRAPRRGTTIVWGPKAIRYPIQAIGGIGDFFKSSGINYEIDELLIRREKATAEIAEALNIEIGSDVYRVSRVYAIGSQPAAYLRHLLPAEIGGRRVRVEQLKDDIVPFLEEVEHIQLTDVDVTVTAERASRESAGRLDVAENDPVLVMYTTLRRQEKPVSLGYLAFRPDVVSLSLVALDHLQSTQRAGFSASLHDVIALQELS